VSILEVRSLIAGYGRTPVLHGIDLAVAEGEVVAVLGANGAGKSTMLRSISGVTRLFSGSVSFAGSEITRLGAPRIAALGIAHVPENRRVFPAHSVETNLRLGGYVRRRDRASMRAGIGEVYERFPLLADRRAQLAGSLSGGQQQVLALAMALVARPRLLMLDEPSLGLAPLAVQQVYDEIRALRDAGSTILLVEQLATVALGVADRAVVLQLGRVATTGTADDVRHDDALRSAYLGA